MSTTNPSPYFKGSGWSVARAIDGSLQGVKVEIWELERKLKVADSRALAQYHEQLEKLKWDREALHEELSRSREEGAPSIPELAELSTQTTPRQKEPAVPAALGTPRVSPLIA